jgi:hypothetical protein
VLTTTISNVTISQSIKPIWSFHGCTMLQVGATGIEEEEKEKEEEEVNYGII